MESGVVGLDEAMMLMRDDDRFGWAQDRYLKHLKNEEGRAKGGLPSDMERWEKTGCALD